MNYRLGENAVLYYSATLATSTTFTVSATKLEEVRDMKVSAPNDAPEYTTRKNGGVKQFATSLTDMTLSGKVKCPAVGATGADVDAYEALRDAWKNKTEIALYALSGLSSAADSEGPAGNFVITKWERDEGNGNVLFMDFEAKPSSFNGWHVASGS